MGKQQSCWFGWWKRLFVYRGEDKKGKKWRWFTKGKKGKRREAIATEAESSSKKEIEEATDKQRQYAVKVAIATAAAAEAAVAAAHAAAEIVRLTITSSSSSSSQKKYYYSDKQLPAIKIQSAFRRYLARKALVALKGVVKLQAVIRGQAVRRRFFNLKHIFPTPETTHFYLQDLHTKLGCKSQRRWDYSMISKEDVETLCSEKHDANLRRDRMIKYSFSHRERRNTVDVLMEESLPRRPQTARHSHCLQLQDLYTNNNNNKQGILNLSTPDLFATLQVRTTSKKDHSNSIHPEGLHSPVLPFPRRSFCTITTAHLPSSPVFPTYMASTESAKAKARSVSTPRQRIGRHESNNGLGLSPCPSYNGDSPYSYKLKSPLLA